MSRSVSASPLAVFFLLVAPLAATPLAALVIVPPFQPFGPIDPALLRAPNQTTIEPIVLEGRVVDDAGEPVPGAEVVLRGLRLCEDCYDEDLNIPTRFTRSDAHGLFSLADLDPEPLASLEISAAGFATASFDLGPLGEKRFESVFRLARGGGVLLRAVDADGKPLPEAKATIWSTADGASLIFLVLAEADESWNAAREDGSIHFRGLRAGLANLVIRSPGRRPLLVGITVPAGGEPLDLGALQLEDAAKLRGRVLDERGEPVAAAIVRVQLAFEPKPQPDFFTGQEVETNAEGAYELPWTVPAGFEYQLLAMAEGYSSAFERFQDEPEGPVELVLGSRRAIRGQVVRQGSGEPVAGCNLFASATSAVEDSDSAVTDDGGFFEMALAPRYEFELNYDCANGWSSLRVGEADERPLHIEVPGGTFLRGRIVGYREEDAASITFAGNIAAAEPDGSFALEGIAPGEGELLVDSDGRSFVVHVKVPEEGLEGLEIEKPDEDKLAKLEGEVYDPWGRLAGLAWVQIHTADGLLVGSASTHADGTFAIERLEPGQRRLMVQVQQRMYFAEVELREGAKKVSIRFPPGATLSGRVEGVAMAEASRLFVRAQRNLEGPGGQQLSEELEARVDAAGHFVLEQLPEGEWSLYAGVVGRSLAAQDSVSVAGTGSVETNLHLAGFD